MKTQLDVSELMNSAIKNIVREAIEQTIGEQTGSAIPGDVKDAIKAEAASILKEPEMQRAIRDRLKHWIGSSY